LVGFAMRLSSSYSLHMSLGAARYPEGERDALFHTNGLLGGLVTHIITFEAALTLCDSAEAYIENVEAKLQAVIARMRAGDESAFNERIELHEQMQGDPVMHWPGIAVRDATMTVYHFGETLKALNFKDAPTLREAVLHDKLRMARKKFDEYFPQIEEVRHSVGHSAEMVKSQEAVQFNSVRGPMKTAVVNASGSGSSVLLSNSLEGRKLTATWADKHTRAARVVSFECSEASLAKLKEVNQLVQEAFAPARDSARVAAIVQARQQSKNM